MGLNAVSEQSNGNLHATFLDTLNMMTRFRSGGISKIQLPLVRRTGVSEFFRQLRWRTKGRARW
jgi:hypothetical protein